MRNTYPLSYRTRDRAIFHAAQHSANTDRVVSVVYSPDTPVKLDNGRRVTGGWVVVRGLAVGATALLYQDYLVYSEYAQDRVQRYWPDQPADLPSLVQLLHEEDVV